VSSVLDLICTVLQLYVLVLLGRVILSWFPLAPGGPIATIYGVMYSVTEPLLGPLRRVIPPIGMLDLSVIVAIIGIQLISASLCAGAAGLF